MKTLCIVSINLLYQVSNTGWCSILLIPDIDYFVYTMYYTYTYWAIALPTFACVTLLPVHCIFILCYRYWAIALPTFACLTLLPVYLFYYRYWAIALSTFACLTLLPVYCIFILCYRYWAIALPTFACVTFLLAYPFYMGLILIQTPSLDADSIITGKYRCLKSLFKVLFIHIHFILCFGNFQHTFISLILNILFKIFTFSN